MLDLEYTEIDGLLYPNIELGIEDIENNMSKYGVLRLRTQAPAIADEIVLAELIYT